MTSPMQENFFPPPAGFWIRVAATFIDGLIFMPIVILLVLDLLWWKSYLLVVLLTLPNLFYKPFMEAYKGATLGKMACGLRVVDERGENLSLRAAYMRSLPQLMTVLVGLFAYALLLSNSEFRSAKTLMDLALVRQPSDFNFAQTAVNFFALIDCLFVPFTARKRALHDFLANSYCVQSRAGEAAVPDDDAFFCSDCDKEIPRDAKFCPYCGANFKES